MIIYPIIGRKKLISYISVILLISSLAGACAAIKRSDIKIKDDKVVQLIKDAIKLYEKEKYEEALERLSQAENRERDHKTEEEHPPEVRSKPTC